MEKQSRQHFDVQKVTDVHLNIKSFSDLTKPNGILQEIMKGSVERMLKAEQEHYLGFASHERSDGTKQRDNSLKWVV